MLRRIRNNPLDFNKDFQDKFYTHNPALMHEHTIPIAINRYFTTVDGTIIDKNDVSIPASLKVRYPIFLLSQFDRNGGYKKSLQVTPPVIGTNYLMTFTQGINSPFLAFTGLNTIKSKLQTGDVVYVYTDDLENPTFFIWFVVSCNSVSVASILGNTESTQDDKRVGVLFLSKINYYVSVRAQFDQALYITNLDNIGNYRSDTIQPSMFLNPLVAQQGFLTLDIKFRIDQYFGITTYMDFTCDQLTMDFIVNKI